MNAIETIGLVKTFGDTRALDDMNLTIQNGSVYGLLGPNGAGKTTVIRVLTTLLKPSGGKAMVLGLDVAREATAVRQKVSLTGQYASIDEELTGHALADEAALHVDHRNDDGVDRAGRNGFLQVGERKITRHAPSVPS